MKKLLAILMLTAAMTPVAADAAAWPKNMLGVWCGGGEENERGVILYGGCDGVFKNKAIILEPKSHRMPRQASGGASICTYDRLEVSTGNRGRIEFSFTARCKDSEVNKCRWKQRATGWAFVTPDRAMEIKWALPFDETTACEPE